MTLKCSTPTPRGSVAGIILHRHGTLRIFRNLFGRLHVEVIGFECDEGRQFLSDLGSQLEDITADILVCDDPVLHGAPVFPRSRHHRREA